jgi:hypothetical protein
VTFNTKSNRTPMPSLARISSALAAVFVTLAACSEPTGLSSVVGVYTLVTANGAPLPRAVDSSMVIDSGRITLRGDRSFQDVLSYHATSDIGRFTVDVTIHGTFRLAGDSIEFTSGTIRSAAAIRGDTLRRLLATSGRPATLAYSR